MEHRSSSLCVLVNWLDPAVVMLHMCEPKGLLTVDTRTEGKCPRCSHPDNDIHQLSGTSFDVVFLCTRCHFGG